MLKLSENARTLSFCTESYASRSARACSSQLCTVVNNLIAPHNICVRKAQTDSGPGDQFDLRHASRSSNE